MSANDNFASAIEIFGLPGSVSGNNSADTLEAGEPPSSEVPVGKTVWYKWTPTESGLANLHLVSTLDTVLTVFIGDTLETLREVATNDETTVAGKSSSLVFLAGAGVQYFIQVAVYNTTAGGAFTLEWEAVTVSATDISGNAGSIAGTTGNGATAATWFRWVSDASDVVEFDLFGAAIGGTSTSTITVLTPTGSFSAGNAGEAGAWPAKVAALASAGAPCYIKVQYAVSGTTGGTFTLRWAVGYAQSNNWYGAAAYWQPNREDESSVGEAALVKAPAPTARLTMRTPSAAALFKTTNPGSTLYVTGGATYWYVQPKDNGQTPTINDWFRGDALDPNGFLSGALPFYSQFAPVSPPLPAEYVVTGQFSLGGFVRPVFGAGRTELVSFEAEFVMPADPAPIHYPAPVVAALSGFDLEKWAAGVSSGTAMHGLVSKDAVPPYTFADLVFGVETIVSEAEVRTDTAYVGGVPVRSATITDQVNQALSLRLTILGTDPAEVTAVSVAGYNTGTSASAQTHGVSAGIAGCKYVYQAQFNANVDYTVASQFTLLTQPYWLGPPNAEFWGNFVSSAETLRITT